MNLWRGLGETIAAEHRAQIKIIPKRAKGFEAAAGRMSTLRRSIREYFEAGEKEGRIGSHILTADRVQQIFEIYGWDKEFVLNNPKRTSPHQVRGHKPPGRKPG